MANNFLLLGLSGVVGWIFINGPPSMEPRERAAVSRVTATDPYAFPHVNAAHSPAIEMRREPVPLVRKTRPSSFFPLPSPSSEPSVAATAESSVAATEQQAQDELDQRAARTAVEMDGYKRVSILGKAANGAWRAKGFRGTTEVLLTVDGTGRVSMD
jgi:hypothetical protein